MRPKKERYLSTLRSGGLSWSVCLGFWHTRLTRMSRVSRDGGFDIAVQFVFWSQSNAHHCV